VPDPSTGPVQDAPGALADPNEGPAGVDTDLELPCPQTPEVVQQAKSVMRTN
jgi:hypothetical protein